ncbi:Daunorubicin/doxorubicin resistance ATP-binding protein DrrA [Planctomycetes bacterium Poly30]|uniref:Daunorubicin/doxorubicin resistance ATP-binding protein DrrA n=2 Tax=Saltatorellus ferox TaxID=2528018 RepID=A0A518EPK9_9BACT|nr:Daunorubicin/doxorubicin resistance ATP-binding protein DrrA [Planctomycetes bacterium Poly30]
MSLRVARGESIGLLGPNGAGKSTTLRILSTLLQPDGGEVSVLGFDPRTHGAEIRASIGVVPQDIALYGAMSAAENLAFFAELAGVPRARIQERVDRALETAGLTERRRSRVSEFSGGMKRRLNLVAALLHEPELIFLDEPTAGVDPQSRNHIFEQVERLRAESGVTLIYTTHQMGEVERLCDRIVIMDRGRSVADGSLKELQGLDAVQRETAPRLRLQDDRDLERAAALLREHGIEFAAESGSADLESIFLGLTGRALRDGDEALQGADATEVRA